MPVLILFEQLLTGGSPRFQEEPLLKDASSFEGSQLSIHD